MYEKLFQQYIKIEGETEVENREVPISQE